MTRVLLWVTVLTAVYVLALASLDPLDVALGVLLAAALLVALRGSLLSGRSLTVSELARRAAAVPRLTLVVLRDITVGTWRVAAVMVGARPLECPGIVAVPFGDRTPEGVVLTSFLATLAPGEFLVEIDQERQVMLFHVLDARDPDAVRIRFAELYERHQRPVLP